MNRRQPSRRHWLNWIIASAVSTWIVRSGPSFAFAPERSFGVTGPVEVYVDDVTIDRCRIHHFLAGTFKDQADAHGVTGRSHRLAIRNCYFYDCTTATPIEDQIEKLEIINPHFGAGLQRRYQEVGKKPLGLRIEGEQDALPLETLLRAGVRHEQRETFSARKLNVCRGCIRVGESRCRSRS